MKTLIALVVSLAFIPSAFAYEVAIKKGVVSVDGVPELTWAGCDPRMAGSVCLVKSMKTQAPLFSVKQVYHDGYYNLDVSFLDFPEETRVKVISLKELVENLYELSVITPEGGVSEANARKFGRMYDTIPDRKTITIIVQ